MTHQEFDAMNDQYIEKFLAQSKGKDCDISGSVKATIVQFLMNFKLEINNRAKLMKQTWISPEDIIECQIMELRRCIVDLEAYRNRLTKGVTVQ